MRFGLGYGRPSLPFHLLRHRRNRKLNCLYMGKPLSAKTLAYAMLAIVSDFEGGGGGPGEFSAGRRTRRTCSANYNRETREEENDI